MADFIVLATADWDHPLWTNKQHTAATLAALGHRVLYVESLGIRSARSSEVDRTRIFRRLKRIFKLPRELRKNLWVWSPPVLPGGHSGTALKLNRLLLQSGLDLVCRWLKFKNPILWTYNPLTGLYLDLEDFAGSIYHCVDRIQDQPNMPAARIEATEQILSEEVNVVFVTSPQLQITHRQSNYHTVLFGNVADHSHFSRALNREVSEPLPCPNQLRLLRRPRLVFMGAIDAYKLDLQLLLKLAEVRPDWSFVLIGPVGECDPSTDVSALSACPNVELTGSIVYNELPHWLAHSDVALLPLNLNNYTRNMFPMKFFEYLSSGLPIVATSIPALQDQKDVAWLCAPEFAAFENSITRALLGEGASLERRVERAATQTYEVRADAMLRYLERVGLLSDAQTSNHDVALVNFSLPQRVVSWIKNRVEGITSSLLVVFSHRLMRSGCPHSAVVILQKFSKWMSADRILTGGLVLPLVRCGDYQQARLVMEELWRSNGEVRELNQLLFRRGNRPADRGDQVLLFEELVTSRVLPLYALSYCQVVLAHRCVDVKDETRMHHSVKAITAMSKVLEQDPGTLLCLQENRRNRTKLLVSCFATLLRLHLKLKQFKDLAELGEQCLDFADRLDLNAIDSDTSYRLTRNLLRVLLINVLEAWTNCDPVLMRRTRSLIEQVHSHCYRAIFNQQSAQENHRGFADAVLFRVQSLERAQLEGNPDKGLEALQILMILILKSERDLVSQDNNQKLLKSVLPQFSHYL